MLNIKWPDKITNQELKEKVKFKPLSETICERRLKWLGHLCRLDEDCPARLALKERCIVVKRKVGRQKTTWINLIRKDLEQNTDLERFRNANNNDFFNEIVNKSSNKDEWRRFVKNPIMLDTIAM